MRLILLFFILIVFSMESTSQTSTDSFLEGILKTNKDSLFQQVLQQPDKYKVQIVYTQINRDKNNKPHFTDYHFHLNKNVYFYPASTVKLPLALLSLEKLNKLHIKGVNKFTAMQFDSTTAKEPPLYKDSTAENGLPSIAQFIRKAFLISDNDAYNRMYQFMGQQNINRILHEKGYKDVRITRQFIPMSNEENRHTNPVKFMDKNGAVLYEQSAAYNKDSFDFSLTQKVGNAYYNRNDSLINEPMDFTQHNNLPLHALQQLLQSVLFPASVAPQQRFQLTEDDRKFLLQYLSQYPSETNYPKYDTSIYYDSYVKFFFDDGSKQMPQNIRVFNKVGWSYGFLTDVSYVADFAHNIEFMLTATVYVNEDGILNDDKYEYDSIGRPFLTQLGKTIYQYELGRQRKYTPDLSAFKMHYETRKEDNRPAIKDADN